MNASDCYGKWVQLSGPNGRVNISRTAGPEWAAPANFVGEVVKESGDAVAATPDLVRATQTAYLTITAVLERDVVPDWRAVQRELAAALARADPWRFGKLGTGEVHTYREDPNRHHGLHFVGTPAGTVAYADRVTALREARTRGNWYVGTKLADGATYTLHTNGGKKRRTK